MKVAILGLAVTSSWGNGHATGYRGLMRALAARGDDVLFLERDVPWYAAQRDMLNPPWGRTELYGSLKALGRFAPELREADLTIVGSYVPDGVAVAEWALERAGGATAFYDIDTPVTIGKLRADDREYLSRELVPRFDLYLSFTGGPALGHLSDAWGARQPQWFPCFVDPESYLPAQTEPVAALNYLGTYAAGRQPKLEELMLSVADRRPQDRFSVAGPMYPPDVRWPDNVERIEHLPPADHPGYYASTRFTLNLTRPEMRALGHSPSVRLFEAAACGAAIISDRWAGLEDVFAPGREIFLADTAADVERVLDETSDGERRSVAAAARDRVLREHTAARRVQQLHELVGR
jgi:spore maturation protein CgeB